jgi:hypothetical protein
MTERRDYCSAKRLDKCKRVPTWRKETGTIEMLRYKKERKNVQEAEVEYISR